MFDYKKLIKDRTTRMKILHLLDWVPDSVMLRMQYFVKTGRFLHLKNPQRYTEKLQWYKLYYKDPLMAQCVDKYEVRKYVEKCGLGAILNECYGIFERVEDIDFDKLPNSFVIKDTLGSGGNDVIVVKDKTQINMDALKRQLFAWLNHPSTGRHSGREWVYENKKHRILIEKNLLWPTMTDLPDYKFFCFNGKAHYLYVISNRVLGKIAKLGIYDTDFHKLPYQRTDELPPSHMLQKPANYTQMILMAERLSAAFPHARVDLFNIDGKIYFGEITFFDGSGYMSFEPDDFDRLLGEPFTLKGYEEL